MKDELRRVIEAGRQKAAADLVPRVDDSPPSQPGGWTAKDHLAHLTAWRLNLAAELDSLRTGAPAPVVAEDDVQNAKFYEETQGLPAAAVMARDNSAWDALVAAVGACTEDELRMPRPRNQREAAWQAVAGNSSQHVAEHLAYMARETGDAAAEESAARWSHEIANAVFSDDTLRGNAEYNLGCFYAVRGRAREAIPYLRKGIELNPDLREWAGKDSDLDPIRSDAELAHLLGVG